MSRRDINPEELLSAYADDGLTADERRVVETYLDDNPSARDELERFRDTLREVKTLSPSVRDEPSWSDMSAAISREIDAVAAEHANTWPQSLWRWMRRPHVVAGFGVAAIAAGAITVFVLRSGSTDPQTPPRDDVAAIDIDPDSMPGLSGADGYMDVEIADLDDLDEDEIDALLSSLSLDDDDDADDVFGDLLEGDDILSAEALAEWTGDSEEPEYTTGLGVDMFDEVDYDWLDELDEDEIDALDRYLDSIQAG